MCVHSIGMIKYYNILRDKVQKDRGTTLVVLGISILLLDLFFQVIIGKTESQIVATYLWDGLVIGLAIGLAGVGLSLTYSILKFANFAHGDMITAGGFSGWVAVFAVMGVGRFDMKNLLLVGAGKPINVTELGISVSTTPLAVLFGLIVAIMGTVLLTLAIDRFVFRPMRHHNDGIALLIASIGVSLALRYGLAFIFKTQNRGLTAASLTASYSIPVGTGSVQIDLGEITLVLVAIALMVGVHVFLQYSTLGKAMRAMADNRDLALITGIPTERVVRATWIIGGALTGAAGFLITLERGTISFQFGWILLLLIFAAVIIGGIGSVYGAIAGGVVIGFTSTISLIWIPADLANVAVFSVMVLVLLYKPEGLFKGVTTA